MPSASGTLADSPGSDISPRASAIPQPVNSSIAAYRRTLAANRASSGASTPTSSPSESLDSGQSRLRKPSPVQRISVPSNATLAARPSRPGRARSAIDLAAAAAKAAASSTASSNGRRPLATHEPQTPPSRSGRAISIKGTSTTEGTSSNRGSYFEKYYGGKAAPKVGLAASGSSTAQAVRDAVPSKSGTTSTTQASQPPALNEASHMSRYSRPHQRDTATSRTSVLSRESGSSGSVSLRSNNTAVSSAPTSISPTSPTSAAKADGAFTGRQTSSSISAPSQAPPAPVPDASVDSVLAGAPPSPPRPRRLKPLTSPSSELAKVSFPSSVPSASALQSLTTAGASSSKVHKSESSQRIEDASRRERVPTESPGQSRQSTRVRSPVLTRTEPTSRRPSTTAPLPLPSQHAAPAAPVARFEKSKEPILSIEEIIRNHQANFRPVALRRSSASQVASTSSLLPSITGSPAVNHPSSPPTPSASQSATPKQMFTSPSLTYKLETIPPSPPVSTIPALFRRNQVPERSGSRVASTSASTSASQLDSTSSLSLSSRPSGVEPGTGLRPATVAQEPEKETSISPITTRRPRLPSLVLVGPSVDAEVRARRVVDAVHATSGADVTGTTSAKEPNGKSARRTSSFGYKAPGHDSIQPSSSGPSESYERPSDAKGGFASAVGTVGESTPLGGRRKSGHSGISTGTSSAPRQAASTHHARAFSGSSVATGSTVDDQFHDAEEKLGGSTLDLNASRAAPAPPVPVFSPRPTSLVMAEAEAAAAAAAVAAITRGSTRPPFTASPTRANTANETDEDLDDGRDSDIESTSSLNSIEREVRRTMRATREAKRTKRKAAAMKKRELEAAERKAAEDAEVLKYLLRQPSPTLSAGSSSREMLVPPGLDGRGSISRRASLNKRASIQSVLSAGAGGSSAGIASPASLSRSGSVRSGTGSNSTPHTPRLLQHAASFAGKASPALLKAKPSKSSVISETVNKLNGQGTDALAFGAKSTPATRSTSPATGGLEPRATSSSATSVPPIPSLSDSGPEQGGDTASLGRGGTSGFTNGPAQTSKFSRLPGASLLGRMTGSSANVSNAATNASGVTPSSAFGILSRRRAESAASSLSGMSARTAALSIAHTSDGELGSDGYTSISFSKIGLEAGAEMPTRNHSSQAPTSSKNGSVAMAAKPRKSAPAPVVAGSSNSSRATGTTFPSSGKKQVQPPLPSPPPIPLARTNSIAQYIRSERLTRIITLRRHPYHGLKVSLADVGAKNGHPVVVFLGLGAVRYLVGLYDDIASAMGLRLICIDRWGLGKTDTVADEQRGVLEWGTVVGEVLDQLGIGRFGILAHSAGAPYAMATVMRQTSARVVGPVHLLAPWVSSQVETNWKWLKYVPDSVIKTAQAAEWKMQAWRLGKQPSLAYEGVGFDARSGDAGNSIRKISEETQSHGHSSGHGTRASKEGSRGSLESIKGNYAAYSRVLDLNNADMFTSISEEDIRAPGDSSSTCASTSAAPFSNGAGLTGFDDASGRNGGSAQDISTPTMPSSPSFLPIGNPGSRRGSGFDSDSFPISCSLPSPTLQLPERKVVKKKSSKFGSFFGTSNAGSTTSLAGTLAKNRDASSSSLALNEKTSMGPSIVRIGADGRKRTTSLSKLRYLPDGDDMSMELIDDGVMDPYQGHRRPLRSASTTSLVLAGTRDKDVPPLPADARLRASVASLPPSSTMPSFDSRTALPPRLSSDNMVRSFSATANASMPISSSTDSTYNSGSAASMRTSSTTSLRTLMRMPSASHLNLDGTKRAGNSHGGASSGPQIPALPKMGPGLGLGLPFSNPSGNIVDQPSSMGDVDPGVLGSGQGRSVSANMDKANTSTGSTSSTSNSSQITDLATALLRASHAESLRGGTADLMTILGRSSRPWGFTYTDIQHPVKVWHGDRDERISLGSAQWMEQEMKQCELIIVKGANHGLMTNIMVVMEALESIDRHRRD